MIDALMMDDARRQAMARARELAAALAAHPDHQALQHLVDECAALERAIDAFHMEGIRFRTFTLDRHLHGRGNLTVDPGDGLRRMFGELKAALQAAGFQTK